MIKRFAIILITTFASLIAILYGLYSSPVYEANAMIQVEGNSSSVPGFVDA